MWDDRYAGPGYLYGTDPAEFLLTQKDFLQPGLKALAVADGEGRNSVYMARQGLKVTAVDSSGVGIEKARKLAASQAVQIDFRQIDLRDWIWEENAYDLVAAVFIQFAGPDFRAEIFRGMKRTLRPGGVLLLHGYTPRQLKYGTGGPPFAENLYTVELLQSSFADMQILRLEEYDAEINEGKGHAGLSALIDLVARKVKQ